MKPCALALPLVASLLPFTPVAALAAESGTAPGADMVAAILGCLPESWAGWVALIVAVCAAVAAFWPRPGEDAKPAVRVLYAVVNAVGCNFKKASNADDAAARTARTGGGGV